MLLCVIAICPANQREEEAATNQVVADIQNDLNSQNYYQTLFKVFRDVSDYQLMHSCAGTVPF